MTQADVVLDPYLLYDFESEVGCFRTSGDPCTFSLTVNGISIPLSGSVVDSNFPITFSSLTATGISVSSSPATVTIGVAYGGAEGEAFISIATLTSA